MNSTPRPAVAGANPALETLPEQPHPHLGLRPARAVAAVCICGVFAFLNLYATQPLLPLFSHLFHASEAMAGLTVSASTFGVALAAPLIGAFAERLNRKRVILVSTLALAVPTLLAATSPGLHTLIVWRFVQGLALPGIFATIITYVGEEWRRDSIALVMSLYVSSTAMGGFLGRFVAGMVTDAFNWRWSFVVLGVLTLIGAGMIARWLPPESPRVLAPHDARAHGLRVVLSHFRNTRLLATFAVGFGMLFTLVATFTYVTFYLADPPFRLSTFGLSNIFAIYLLGLAVTPLGGYLVTRIGMRRGILLAIVLCLAGEAIALSHSLWIVILPGLGLVCSGVFIAQSTAASYLRMAAPPGGRVSAAGLYLSSYYIGGTVGGVVPGWLWRIGHWPACVALTEGVLVLLLAVALAGWTNAGWSTH
ncbi:MAG TPA: MFS transporter [Acidobacteriaceae bacterium]|nr:MFS transporter [Acidobacteriaceae bacterium]